MDARLHIHADGHAEIVEEHGTNQGVKKECFWWEIILPENEYVFYLFYTDSA